MSIDTSTALLPCPFCGGEAKQRTLTEDEFGNEGADVIECSQCCASSHIEFGRKENLVSAWNTRALVPTLVAECDDLRAQLADARENARWAYVQAALEDNQEALTEANARADRAEAALAAQIEADAGIVESERKLWDQGYNTSSTGHCVCLSLAKVRDAILARANQIEKGES